MWQQWSGANLQQLKALLEGRNVRGVREFLGRPDRSAVSELEVSLVCLTRLRQGTRGADGTERQAVCWQAGLPCMATSEYALLSPHMTWLIPRIM